jgi:SAM-dependent methyltransferase
MSRSNEYIFKNNKNVLELVGDFEGYYQDNEDPWDQVSTDSDISDYYKFSRERLITYLKLLDTSKSIMDVGCGLGIVSNDIKKSINYSFVYGVDISETAIKKATSAYKDVIFSVGDISSPSFKFNKKVDVIILNQMLWYILKDLDVTIINIHNLLNNQGILVISMAFLEQQNYGIEFIDGFKGLIRYCQESINDKFELVFSDFDDSGNYSYNDGLVCLKKINGVGK